MLVHYAVGGILLFATFAFGGRYGWAIGPIEAAVAVVAAYWIVRGSRFVGGATSGVPRAVRTSAALLLLYVFVQTVPLPPGMVAVLSPATHAIHRNAVAAIESLPDARAEITPLGSPEHQTVSVEQRRRIGRYAERMRGRSSSDWRPIALYPYAARIDLLRYVAYGLFLWLAASLPRPRTLLYALFTVGSLAAALALVQYATWNGRLFWFFEPPEGISLSTYNQMFGPFVNPDHFAAFVAMTLVPSIGLPIQMWSARSSAGNGQGRMISRPLSLAFLCIGLAIMFAALIGAASRGAFVGASAGLLVTVAGLRVTRRRRVRRERPRRRLTRAERFKRLVRTAAPAVLGIAIIFGGLLFAGSRVAGILETRLNVRSVGATAGFRLSTWSQTVPILGAFPIFGVGAGGWRDAFQQYKRYPLNWVLPNHAHNDYLEWATEVGLVGVALTLF
ncbi:MAG: O-antigen ligase family protein, partial [Candidatus Binatia bacterium]